MSKWGAQNHWNSIGNTIISAPGRQGTQFYWNILKITEFHHFLWNFTKKSSKVRKWWYFLIWTDFDGPRADFPLQNLCNSLGFSRSGHIRVGALRAGTVFQNSAGKSKIPWFPVESTGNCKNNRNLQIFVKFRIFLAPARTINIPKELLMVWEGPRPPNSQIPVKIIKNMIIQLFYIKTLNFVFSLRKLGKY